jgi:hypothetical protein
MVDREAMKTYSEHLRQKAVEQRGIYKSEAARLFGISLSLVKRYTRVASEGEPRTPRRGSGRPPIADQVMKRLLEEDIRIRLAATVKGRGARRERAQRVPRQGGVSVTSLLGRGSRSPRYPRIERRSYLARGGATSSSLHARRSAVGGPSWRLPKRETQ